MKKSLVLFLGLAFLLLPRLATAWSGPGHLAIAAEAYRELSPELRAEAFDVLKAHPDFAKWEKAYHPNPNLDLAAYVFLRSSTWPDEIRRSGNQYDHPNWHFIDYPLRPPIFPPEPGPKPEDDVLFGVAQCEKTLSDTNADPELRAAMLSYLIHLVGDMHQPLHCTSLFTAAYPKGDRGGNDFYVKPAQHGVRLHGIWDDLLGSSPNPRTQWNYAIEIEAKYPRASLPELTAHPTPKEWSLECRELAIKRGYMGGELPGSTSADTAPALPAGYLKGAKAVAERQAALAGYRLADEIQKYLKCGSPVPLLPENTNAAPQTVLPKKIGTAEASKFYDETMVVTGKVVQVTLRANVAFLNLDQPGPDSPFTAVIFQENFGPFGDLQKFKGQAVEINGTITEYHDKPEIILESPGQVKVVDGK
ncbi:MAG: S1/P1 nuclease [Limisphaerales bacterium]